MGIGSTYGLSTLGDYQEYVGWKNGTVLPYGIASGGSSSTITVGGVSYTLLTFTSDGTLTVSKSGLLDVLLVGGGGGGGGNARNVVGICANGGGGGGQIIQSTLFLTAGTYTIDIGAGGVGGWDNNYGGSRKSYAGNISSIGSVAFAGGGCGGGYAGSAGSLRVAGSGSGSGGQTGWSPSDLPTPILGANLGGTSSAATNAGGGGGAGGAGGNGTSTTGGAGGNGLDISTFIGGSTYYAGAGGGGAGSVTGGAAGNGGVAGKTSGVGNAGVNYGAGGGGTYTSADLDPAGGAGAAGVVYVRFL